MTRRRARIPRRKPVFFGCEGASEEAYGQVLYDHIRQNELSIHLNTVALTPGAGDPLARVQRAIQRIQHIERQRTQFWLKAILMDSDQTQEDPERTERAVRLAADNEICIIWQDPCHEAFLLRHLPNCATRRPASAVSAGRDLQKEWPDYAKPMTRVKLAERIGPEEIAQASLVEPGFRSFLQDLGLRL